MILLARDTRRALTAFYIDQEPIGRIARTLAPRSTEAVGVPVALGPAGSRRTVMAEAAGRTHAAVRTKRLPPSVAPLARMTSGVRWRRHRPQHSGLSGRARGSGPLRLDMRRSGGGSDWRAVPLVDSCRWQLRDSLVRPAVPPGASGGNGDRRSQLAADRLRGSRGKTPCRRASGRSPESCEDL